MRGIVLAAAGLAVTAALATVNINGVVDEEREAIVVDGGYHGFHVILAVESVYVESLSSPRRSMCETFSSDSRNGRRCFGRESFRTAVPIAEHPITGWKAGEL
jgi:hypothetical protein